MNSFQLLNPALFDYIHPEETGYSEKMQAGDTRDVLWDVCGSASRKFPKSMEIDPKDWADRASDNDKYKAWAMNHVDRYTNQSPTHECTCHSLRTNFEVARNKALGIIFPEGPKKDFRYIESAKFFAVWVSALSIYAEANPGKWGGANVQQVLEIAFRRGFLPDKTQPNQYNFKHDLVGTNGQGNSNQSNGDWVSVRNFPDGWKETAKHFRPLEVIFPESYEEAVCLLLHGYAVSVGRSGHAIPWCQYLPGQGAAYPDSYNVTRYDSERTLKSAWRGSFCIISTTIPDDFSKPAG